MNKFSVILFVTVVFSSMVWADGAVPMNGIFDIDGTAPSPVSFNPVPWVSPDLITTVNMYPFATTADPYSGFGDNLAWVKFADYNITVKDYGEQTGDLGIRFNNSTGDTQTFIATVLTLQFTSQNFNVYLPEFTFAYEDNIYFWASTTGATYYANSSKGPGFPDMSATTAMAAGDLYLAATPEPATVLIFGLGAVFLRRIRR